MSSTTKKRHLDIITPIKEMTSDVAYRIKVDDAVLQEITDGDDSPQFVIAEFGECKSQNNVFYDRKFFTTIAEQINSKLPTGYMGHKHTQGLDKEDLLPDPQVVWLAASVETVDNVPTLVTKGYLIRPEEGGKARAWLKRKAINSVSWTGDAALTLGKDGAYRVREFFLESIDFARKNRAGVGNQRLTVVTEMTRTSDGGTVMEDEDVGKIIGRLTFYELNESNPALVNSIKEMAKDEAKTETARVVAEKETELTAKHQQELESNPDITMMQKVKELLGIKDDPTAKPDEVLSALLSRLDSIGQELVESWFKTEILEKKVPENARSLVKRLVPIKEMAKTGDVRSDRGIERVKEKLEEAADELLENDDEIKTVIKEMAANRGGGRLSDRGHSGGGNRDFDKGKKNGDDDDDGYRSNDNLEVTKVRVG